MNTYRVEARYADGWWMVAVPELGLLAQARAWNEIEIMSRGLVATWLDVGLADVGVRVEPAPDLITHRQRVKEANRSSQGQHRRG